MLPLFRIQFTNERVLSKFRVVVFFFQFNFKYFICWLFFNWIHLKQHRQQQQQQQQQLIIGSSLSASALAHPSPPSHKNFHKISLRHYWSFGRFHGKLKTLGSSLMVGLLWLNSRATRLAGLPLDCEVMGSTLAACFFIHTYCVQQFWTLLFPASFSLFSSFHASWLMTNSRENFTLCGIRTKNIRRLNNLLCQLPQNYCPYWISFVHVLAQVQPLL